MCKFQNSNSGPFPPSCWIQQTLQGYFPNLETLCHLALSGVSINFNFTSVIYLCSSDSYPCLSFPVITVAAFLSFALSLLTSAFPLSSLSTCLFSCLGNLVGGRRENAHFFDCSQIKSLPPGLLPFYQALFLFQSSFPPSCTKPICFSPKLFPT